METMTTEWKECERGGNRGWERPRSRGFGAKWPAVGFGDQEARLSAPPLPDGVGSAVPASKLLGVEALWPRARTDLDNSGPGLEEQPGKQPAPRRSAGELGDMHVCLPALLGT